MNSEKLVITLEIDAFPEDCKIVDFRLTIVENGWMNRIFKNWKKITYKYPQVTKMTVEKNI